MKFRASSYWLLLLTFLVLSFLGTSLRNRSGGSRPQFLVDPNPQAAPISAQELEIIASHEGVADKTRAEATALIKGPVRIEADNSSGNLFIIDEGRGESLSEFSPSGTALHVFTELTTIQVKSITDLAILPDRLWVADLLGSSLHTLERKHGRWDTLPLAAEPYRVEVLNENLVLMRVVAPQLFDLTDLQGNVSQSFGDLLRRQNENALALDGYIVYSKGRLIYTGKYLGVLASFSPDGHLSYLVQTASPPPYPFVMSQGRRRWLRHEPVLASLSLAASDGTVFVLSRRRVGLGVRSAVDLYRVRDGRYKKTLLLPASEKWTSIAVTHGNLYAASERRIVRWPTAGLTTQAPAADEISKGRSFLDFKASGT